MGSHMRTLRVAHLTTPGLIHTTTLIHSSHTLIHSTVTSHISISTTASTSHHLTLTALISPCWISTPISRLLLLRPLLLLHHLRLLILALLLLLLLWVELLLLLLLWNTSLLPR